MKLHNREHMHKHTAEYYIKYLQYVLPNLEQLVCKDVRSGTYSRFWEKNYVPQIQTISSQTQIIWYSGVSGLEHIPGFERKTMHY